MENCDFFVDGWFVVLVVVVCMVAKLSLEFSLATMLGDDEIFFMLHGGFFPVAFEFGHFVVAAAVDNDDDELAVLDA